MVKQLEISPTIARRLAIQAQRLDRLPDRPDKDAMYAVIRQVRCLQIDPINVVARSPLLVLFSRLGNYQPADLGILLWEECLLFEYWAHAASVVLTEDFPIFQLQMSSFAQGSSAWARRVREWLVVNEPFQGFIKQELAERGPLFASELEDRSVEPWKSSGWTNARNVRTMLGFMWEKGDITVTRRQGAGFGIKKQWGLLNQHMPQWAGFSPGPGDSVVRKAAQISLKALGVATEKHIQNHFVRGGYPNLDKVMADLVQTGDAVPISIGDNGTDWPEQWYIHSSSLADLERLLNGNWSSRTVLLSPFDNLIADRERTELLFNFHYRSEIYTPKAKRKYGYYVMPILHGDRLIGRVDPKFDRKSNTLHVFAVHAEEDAPMSIDSAQAVAGAVGQLGHFLGAQEIQYGNILPSAWAAAFRNGTL